MPGRHPPDKPVEDREQTRHKLEAMVRYWGAWLEILAKTRSRYFCTRHLWLVDLMSGSGHHESREHPDRVRAGTSVLAAWRATQTQQAHPGVRVTLHACDIDATRTTALDAGLEPLRGVPPDGITAIVHQGDYADFISPIIDEISRPCETAFLGGDHDHRSLWLLDPYGVADIPRRSLDHIEALTGSELIINLDTVDVGRFMHVVRSGQGPVDEDAAHLDALFGDDRWRTLTATRLDEGFLSAVSDLYSSTFGRYGHRVPYRMKASSSQIRHLVHLSNHPKARGEFDRQFRTAMTAGTITGRALDQTQRAALAQHLAGLLDGVTLTLDELEPLAGLPDRGQLRAVCRTAADRGLATFDAATGEVTWHGEPLQPRTLPLGL